MNAAAGSRQREFAIATTLLDDSDSGWSNLGLWTSGASYADACAALARVVGVAAHLDARTRLLEPGCGQGAALALWQQEFGVQRITAFEFRQSCVDAIQSRLSAQSPVPDIRVCQGRFDRLPLPAPLKAADFSAVACVDAACHADSLAAFAAFAATALETNGRLAFTTLLQGSGWREGSAATRGLQWALARANIPAASVPAAEEAKVVLAGAGFADIRIEFLDAGVLAGFAEYVARRRSLLPWRAKCSGGWLKIRMTAALCRHAQRTQGLHYALLSARRC